MTAQIINGKEIAQQFCDDLAQQIKQLKKMPKLAVILVGDNPASLIYVRNKQKKAQEIGMECEVFHFAELAQENEIVTLIEQLNMDKSVNGIIVQLPMPKHLNETHILETVQQDKDVDAFKQVMSGALWQKKAPWASATPQGVLLLLKKYVDNLCGKHAVIIGRSNIVGKPMAALLLNEDCTVTISHSKTIGLKDIVKTGDIVVVACGVPRLVKKDWVKPGAVIIDVGISKVDGKLCGDVDFDEVKDVAGAITPVPGGVGPMTIAMLLKNTYTAYLKQMDNL